MDNIEKWMSLPMAELLPRASCRKDRKTISAELSIMSPDDPTDRGTELYSLDNNRVISKGKPSTQK